MRWKKAIAGIAVGAMALVGTVGAAWANQHDEIQAADDDGLVLTNQGSSKVELDFGSEVCAGSAPTLDVTLTILRGTRDAEHSQVFEDEAEITITSEELAGAVFPAGTSLSRGAADPIALPDNWESKGTTVSDATVSTLTLNAGATTGVFTFEVRYRGTGARSDDPTKDNSVTTKFDVVGEIIQCSNNTQKAAPAIANEYLNGPAAPDHGDCRTALGTNWNGKNGGSNWRGNLISAVAHEFNNSPDKFNESAVQVFVAEACDSGLS